MSPCKHIKLIMRSDNRILFAVNKQVCGRKALACIEVGSKETWNLIGEVATD